MNVVGNLLLVIASIVFACFVFTANWQMAGILLFAIIVYAGARQALKGK